MFMYIHSYLQVCMLVCMYMHVATPVNSLKLALTYSSVCSNKKELCLNMYQFSNIFRPVVIRMDAILISLGTPIHAVCLYILMKAFLMGCLKHFSIAHEIQVRVKIDIHI